MTHTQLINHFQGSMRNNITHFDVQGKLYFSFTCDNTHKRTIKRTIKKLMAGVIWVEVKYDTLETIHVHVMFQS